MIWGSEVYTPLQAGGDSPRRHCLLPTLPETVATTILDKGINDQRRAILKVRGVSVDMIKFVSGQINIRYVGDEECKNFVERCRLYHEGLTERFEDAAEGHMRLTGAARLPMPRPWKPKTEERRPSSTWLGCI
ncbi:hypothetical protein QBC32DRAFT_346551 [Pseudoneurospora amorphoporcata]|uniref:Uncharacterized protein n=1 Tax=Pseudoneurospora amorphoporcata TaxID=241081 RepID=A0AAN6NV61_9PEZI|nr:hypothetical protein QBC32DRAFT_346551 [Pseudoneurospora amorphoporcata]